MVRTVRSCAIVYAFALNDELLSRRVVLVQSIRDYVEMRGLSWKRNLVSLRSAEKYAESGSVKRRETISQWRSVRFDFSTLLSKRRARKFEKSEERRRSSGSRRVLSFAKLSATRRLRPLPLSAPPSPRTSPHRLAVHVALADRLSSVVGWNMEKISIAAGSSARSRRISETFFSSTAVSS